MTLTFSETRIQKLEEEVFEHKIGLETESGSNNFKNSDFVHLEENLKCSQETILDQRLKLEELLGTNQRLMVINNENENSISIENQQIFYLNEEIESNQVNMIQTHKDEPKPQNKKNSSGFNGKTTSSRQFRAAEGNSFFVFFLQFRRLGVLPQVFHRKSYEKLETEPQVDETEQNKKFNLSPTPTKLKKKSSSTRPINGERPGIILPKSPNQTKKTTSTINQDETNIPPGSAVQGKRLMTGLNTKLRPTTSVQETSQLRSKL
jgi:hypothetical protein